jgi:ATP sulfurylase
MATRARRCWHALIRQNFGCPFDAHQIFDQLWPGGLICKLLKIDITFYCRSCCGMARAETCPHAAAMLLSNAEGSPKFNRPEASNRQHDHRANLRYSHRC